jgi:predicted O-methyltransferase YrrM
MSDAIVSLIDELEELRKTRDDHWQIPRAEGEMLHHIALTSHARTIVEVGTSYGFSGLFWSRALKQTGGHLHTIDRDPKKFESSKQTFQRAGVSDVVTNYLGDAQGILATMPAGIDIAFIDADKPATQTYLDLIWPKIRVGGSVIIDNATTHKKELADVVKALRSRPDARSTEVAVGNGIEWVIKIG